MSGYDSLVGQAFRRRGVRWTIVRCEGTRVLATADGAAPQVLPLAEVLETLEVPEITVTELPDAGEERPGA